MKRLSKYSAILTFLMVGMFMISSTKTHLADITIHKDVDMRNGPGSYYKLILRLKPGAKAQKMEKEQQWVKIKYESKVGWIPQRSAYLKKDDQELETTPDQDQAVTDAQDAFDELAGNETDTTESTTASPAQVAAAVKGFSKKFASRKAGNEDIKLLKNFDGFIDPASYHRFKNKRQGSWNPKEAQSRFPLSSKEAPVLNPQREQVGWAISNVIAQQGLVENKSVQRYLTYVAIWVAENTKRYETPVQVYILDSNQITGYASPNGAIFVSKRLLQLMNNESEFAFFVAHELTHIVLNHGVKETKKRRTKILAERRYEELDQETGGGSDQFKKVEEELTEWAGQMYEYTIKDRLNQYEYQADHRGIGFTYRAGYNPRNGLNLLQRIYNKQGDFEDGIGKPKWKGSSLQKRIIKIESQIDDLDVPDNFGHSHRNVFRQHLRGL